MKKLIVLDCDGILLNWIQPFDRFLARQGHKNNPNPPQTFDLRLHYNIEHIFELIHEFNESEEISRLPPVSGAQAAVVGLARRGWRFHVVTSLSQNPVVRERRIQNLTGIFGDVFDHIECLAIGESKHHYLKHHFEGTDHWWIEDHAENAEAGVQVGLPTLLLDYPHNRHYTGLAHRVHSWLDIVYKIG